MQQQTVRRARRRAGKSKSQAGEFGVCLFDDPNNPNGGTACIKNSVSRINRISELDTGIIWWTNINYRTFSTRRLYLQPNLRSDQLLRVPYHALLTELGLANEPPTVIAPILYRLINRITKYLAEQYGVGSAQMNRLDWELKKHIQRRGKVLRGSMGGLHSAARDAHTYVHSAIGRAPSNTEIRTYILPRTTHLRKLVTLPYPDPKGEWESVQFKTPRLLEPGALPEPLTLERPVFVKINIRNGDPDFFTYTPFTRLSGRSSQMRSWATLPEALMYAAHGDVEVSRAWIGRYAPLSLLLQPPDEQWDFSYSVSLIAEAMFFAIGSLTKPDESNGLEPIAAYLLSYDRMATQRLASNFFEAGFTPLSHGSMRVTAAAHYADLEELDDIATDMGLEPPMYEMEEILDDE